MSKEGWKRKNEKERIRKKNGKGRKKEKGRRKGGWDK